MTAYDSGVPGPAQPERAPEAFPTSGPPPVPAGPGVRPPFAAPPVRKEPGKLALWLILGGLGVVVCLVAGGIGLGGALISAYNDTDREARTAVSDYLDALRDEQYGDAYRMTCRAHRKEVSEESFAASKRGAGRLDAYQLDTILPVEAPDSDEPEPAYAVPAELRFDDGSVDYRHFVVVREPLKAPKPGDKAADAEFGFRVCGEQTRRPTPNPT
ncbi:MAG: hypothetical protein GEU94_09635 [Micromonosporaceae bacterium]|nr:hypothetical protein [Micromonosporaceae bacterium]